MDLRDLKAAARNSSQKYKGLVQKIKVDLYSSGDWQDRRGLSAALSTRLQIKPQASQLFYLQCAEPATLPNDIVHCTALQIICRSYQLFFSYFFYLRRLGGYACHMAAC